MTIDATNPGKVSIHPANTLFTNPGLAPVTVGGTGRMGCGTLADTILIDNRPTLIIAH